MQINKEIGAWPVIRVTVTPFAQTLGYNAFGDLTVRNTDVWGADGGFTANYTNGRKTNSIEVYDPSGNVVGVPTSSTDYKLWTFDASGRNVETKYRWFQPIPSPQIDRTETITKTYDGDGLDTKRVDRNDYILYPGGPSTSETAEYYVRSSVLGGKVVTELDQNGAKKLTNVYAGSSVLAEQRINSSGSSVSWRHEDSITGSYRKIDQSGNEASGTLDSPNRIEFDPVGGSVPTIDPLTDPLLSQPSSMRFFKHAGDVNRPEYGCVIDGQLRSDARDCNRAMKHGVGRLSEAHDQPVEILRELGIHVRWNPVSGRKPPEKQDPNTTYGDGGKWEYHYIGSGEALSQVNVADCSNDNAVGAFPFINTAIIDAFNRAMRAVNDRIGAIGFTEMFRPTSRQKDIYDERQDQIKNWEKSWKPSAFGYNPKPYPAAAAGTSSHEAGYSFDIPKALLNGSRGEQLINILAQNNFVRDVMPGTPLGDIYGADEIHFTHSSWGNMNDNQRAQAISGAQAAWAKLGLPNNPGTAMSAPRAKRPECN